MAANGVCPIGPSPERLESRGLAWVIGAFVICPCHLPLTLWAIAGLSAGTAAGAMVGTHPVATGLAITAIWAAATWRGLRYLLTAQQ